VLVRPGDGGFYLLDRLGALIWSLCDGVLPVDEVIAAIAQELEEPVGVVAGDVREWIAELRVEQLLVSPGGHTPSEQPQQRAQQPDERPEHGSQQQTE
jgi:hypothetical protein